MVELVRQNTHATNGAGEVPREIARVAEQLFATKGYDATSVREIAEAAHVTKPTLYYHFGSKEGLAQAILKGPMVRIVERSRTLLAQGADPVAVLMGLTEEKFADCRANPDRWRFVLALAFGPHASAIASLLTEHADEMDALVDQAVERLAEIGRINREDVVTFSTCLRGLSIIHTLDFLYRGRPLGPDLADRLVADLLRGFGLDRGASS